MSLIRYSRASPDSATILRKSRCRAESWVSKSNSVMPMMAFIGVRISWLMLAKNRLLARLAASAASLACDNNSLAWASWAVRSRTRISSSSCDLRRASSACLRSVTSWISPLNIRRPPTVNSLIERSMGNVVPSLRRPATSRPMPMILRSPVRR